MIAHSGCYGILLYNNLTSWWRKTVFTCCLTLRNARSCIHTFIHILSLFKLVVFLLCFVLVVFFSHNLYSSSCKTGNQACKTSVLLVSLCIHYPAGYLHLLSIFAVQSKLQFLTQQQKPDTRSGFIRAFTRSPHLL